MPSKEQVSLILRKVWSVRSTRIWAPNSVNSIPAKYALDEMRREKGMKSKEVAARKKADKKADVSDLAAASKGLDE